VTLHNPLKKPESGDDTLFSDLYISRIQLKKPDEEAEGSYVFTLPVVRNLGQLELSKKVTFFVGENGTGKSTLLEAVAVNYGFNPEGGTKNFNFSSKETHSPLHRYLTLAKGVTMPKDGFFLRAESFYNEASEVDRLDVMDFYGGKSLHQQSHGESFLSLMLNRFGGNGLYILDEPEAALSPSRQFTMLAMMADLVKKKSQFIIATHSPILMAFPGADIFVLQEDGIRLTPYEETEHYVLTKLFLDNPQRMLKELCK
jgi:predicted ATPase